MVHNTTNLSKNGTIRDFKYTFSPTESAGLPYRAADVINTSSFPANNTGNQEVDLESQHAFLYIVVVLLLYSTGITIGIITYLKRERREMEEEKEFEQYMAVRNQADRFKRYFWVQRVVSRLDKLEDGHNDYNQSVDGSMDQNPGFSAKEQDQILSCISEESELTTGKAGSSGFDSKKKCDSNTIATGENSQSDHDNDNDVFGGSQESVYMLAQSSTSKMREALANMKDDDKQDSETVSMLPL